MSQNIVIKGLGSPLLVSEGYGRTGGTVEVPITPGEIVSDFLTRMRSLFVTQFRRTRDISSDIFPVLAQAPAHTIPALPESGEPITDYADRAASLFVTQFRRHNVRN